MPPATERCPDLDQLRAFHWGDLPEDDAALAQLLDTEGVVVARVSPEDKLRVALHFYNVEDDIDTLLDALARHRSLLA